MKILIVGAGPIGCYAARLFLASGKKDIDVQLIEEHSEIGKPVHCAGLVSRDVFNKAKIEINNSTIINNIDGAEIFLNGDSFRISRKGIAVVIDRPKFDFSLGENLPIDFNTRCIGIEKRTGGYLIETDQGEYYADVVIGADGANSSVRKFLSEDNNIEYLRGVQFRLGHKIKDSNFVEVYLRNKFFAWVIPESPDICRVGIISDNPYNDLKDYLRDTSIKGEILDKFAGLVPVGTCLTQKDGLALVGDAACQTKPLTYGGVYYGMRCAEILVDSILEGALDNYESGWRQVFEKEIQTAIKIRKIYGCLSQENIKEIFNFLKHNSEILERSGDFENHTKTISMLFNNPRLPLVVGKIFLNILKDIRFSG